MNSSCLKILVLSRTSERDGIADYTRQLFRGGRPKDDILSISVKNISPWQMFTAPFRRAQIIHIHHEFLMFDRFISITAFGYFTWLKFWSLICGNRVVTTFHSTYDVNNIDEALAHLMRWRHLFPIICIYLRLHIMFVTKCSNKIIVLSKLGKENLAKILSAWIMQHKVVYVHLGTYSCSIAMKKSGLLWSRYSINKEESIFTLFGFAFPQKGYEFAIKAMNILVNQRKREDIRLVIVSGDNIGAGLPGGGQGLSYIVYLRKLTTQYHLDDKIIFTGYLANDDPLLENIFADTYCFLFPYRNRHFASGAISTVLATHKPVLVSDIRSFEEYEGLMSFAKENAIALADKMMDFLDNPQKMTELAAISRYNAEKFSMDKAFLRHVEIYRELSRKLVK